MTGGQVAAVVTAHRIGPVLADTLMSLVDQRGVDLAAIVLIVDGCPQAQQTHAIARRMSRALPDRFRVLWVPNGGVSRARNVSVRWVLQACPDIEAVFLLDGDDLVPPDTVAVSLECLRKAGESREGRPGWVFSNKQNFGAERSHIDTPAHFRPGDYLAANLSQPSCLYARTLFEEGVFWDETMTSGLEDWAYWLSAIDKGFAGVMAPGTTLYYRQLAGARSSVNRRNDALNLPYMQARHAAMFSPEHLLQQDRLTCPRYALKTPEGYSMFSDPDGPHHKATDRDLENAIAGRLHRGAEAAYLYDPYFPDLVVCAPGEIIDLLGRTGALRATLSGAEAAVNRGASAVGICLTSGRPSFSLGPQARLQDAHAIIVSTVAATRRRGQNPVDGETVQVSVNEDVPTPTPGLALGQVQELERRIADLRAQEAGVTRAYTTSGPRHIAGAKFARHDTRTAAVLTCGPLFPVAPARDLRRIALLIPEVPCPAWGAIFDRIARLGPEDIALAIAGQGDLVPKVPGSVEHLVRDRLGLGMYRGSDHRGTEDRICGVLGAFDTIIAPADAPLLAMAARVRGLGRSVHLTWDPAMPEAPVLGAPGAYDSLIVADPGGRAALEALGVPRTRIDPGACKLLGARDPGETDRAA